MPNNWDHEEIPNNSLLYRFIYKTRMDKKNKRIPSESNFAIRKGHEGLSVDWDKYTTPENSLARISKTYRFKKEEFKDYRDYLVFELRTGFVQKIPEIKDIVHNPLFFGDPPPKGKPNNRSHSLIRYEDHNDPEIRLKLRDHAHQVEINEEKVNEIIANWN